VHDLRKSVNRQLSGRLNTSLSLAHDLQADDEIDSNTLGKNEQVWRVLFANSSSIDRLEIVRSLEKENGEALVRNYDKYLKEWEEVLSGDPTLSPEAVLRKIIAAEQKFKYASTRGKIGLSRTLREVIDTSSTSKFSALLELYEELLRRDAGHGDSLPELEDWIKKYSKGSTTERRELTKKLHISVSALMLSKSAENSTES
jgi:hypothetical protein